MRAMSIRSGRPTPTACIRRTARSAHRRGRNIRRGLTILGRLIWHVGIRGTYRRAFWRFALGRLRHGDLHGLIMVSLVAHHLILFAEEASSGRRDASHYTFKPRERLVAAE